MKGYIIPETAWEKAKLGKFSGSEFWKLYTEPQKKADKEAGNLSKTAISYVQKKVSEIITGTFEHFENDATEWGSDNEPLAAKLVLEKYPKAIYYGKDKPDFLPYTDLVGVSSDMVIPTEFAVVEIKCPQNPANHINYCDITDSEALKDEFKECWYQLQLGMAAWAKYWGVSFMDMKGIFVSYCPIINKPYKDFHLAIIEPDHDFFFNLPKVIEKSERELINRLNKMKSHE